MFAAWSAGGVWVTPEAGGPMVWQETGEGRAPLVASVLEQFGRMTALARETTSNLLTSTWGVQPGTQSKFSPSGQPVASYFNTHQHALRTHM